MVNQFWNRKFCHNMDLGLHSKTKRVNQLQVDLCGFCFR